MIASLGDRKPGRLIDQVVLKDKPWDKKTKTVRKGGLLLTTSHYAGTRGDPIMWTAPAIDDMEDIKAPMMLILSGTLVPWAVEDPRTCADLHEKLVDLTMR